MTDIGMKEAIFIFVSAMTIVPCFIVAFSRNILYSAFSLFFTFLGASGLYFFLDADFLALVQLVIYIGGVLVLLLFAILLTRNINNIKSTNAFSKGRALAAGAGVTAVFCLLGYSFLASGRPFAAIENPEYPLFTVKAIGRLLLGKYLLPFEAASILLLSVLIGSLVIAGSSVRKDAQ